MQKIIEHVIGKVTDKSIESKILRKPELRGSQLPICEVYFMGATLLGGIEQAESYMSDFYTSIGTAIHENFQKWAGRMGVLFGNWVCKRCNKVISNSFGPNTCCNTEMQYKEIEFEKDGLLCHFDGIIKVKDKLYLLEIKSISMEKLETEELPYKNHYSQATTYAYIAKTFLNLPIKGTIILYLARNAHNKYAVFYEKGVHKESYEMCMNTYKKCIKKLEKKKFNGPFNRTCQTIEESKKCPLHAICFYSDEATTQHLKDFYADCEGNFTIGGHSEIKKC